MPSGDSRRRRACVMNNTGKRYSIFENGYSMFVSTAALNPGAAGRYVGGSGGPVQAPACTVTDSASFSCQQLKIASGDGVRCAVSSSQVLLSRSSIIVSIYGVYTTHDMHDIGETSTIST